MTAGEQVRWKKRNTPENSSLTTGYIGSMRHTGSTGGQPLRAAITLPAFSAGFAKPLECFLLRTASWNEMRRPNKATSVSRPTDDTDAGVRDALLAALTALHESCPTLTLAQYLVVLEVLAAESRGEPHTLTTLKRQLGLPHATASRLVWTLTAEGGGLAVLRYEHHPSDRRSKYLRSEPGTMRKMLPRGVIQAIRTR